MEKPRLFWLVEVRDGMELLVRFAATQRRYSEDQMGDLLRSLVAKLALSPREIVEAHGRKGERTDLLAVHVWQPYTVTCGGSVNATARLLPDNDRQIARARQNPVGL